MTQPHYRTTDIYLACFLLHCEVVLVGCRRLSPKKSEFHFAADARLHQLLRLYWSGERTSLVPSRLLTSLRYLKRRGPDAPVPKHQNPSSLLPSTPSL